MPGAPRASRICIEQINEVREIRRRGRCPTSMAIEWEAAIEPIVGGAGTAATPGGGAELSTIDRPAVPIHSISIT